MVGNTALANDCRSHPVFAGLAGLSLSRNKEVDTDPVLLPGDTSEKTPRQDLNAPEGTENGKLRCFVA